MTDSEMIVWLRMVAWEYESGDIVADRIEYLLREISLLNTAIDMLHVAWDQTTAELTELKEKSKEN